MTSRVRRHVVAGVVVGGLAAALISFRLLGNVLDVSEEGEGPQLSPRQRELVSAIEQLRADNGLFTASVGSAGRPGLYESAHGLAVLRAVSKKPIVPVSVTPEQLRRDAAAEIRREPLRSVLWLSEIESATGRSLHSAGDVAALLDSFSAEGFVRDPAAPHNDVSSRLGDTSRALGALRQFGSELPASQRSAVRSWAEAAERAAPDRPVQLYHLADIAAALGETPPESLEGRAETWWRQEGSGLSSPLSEDDLIEACYYALLVERLGTDVPGRRSALLSLLSQNRGEPTDAQVDALLARAWRALDGPADRLGHLADRVRSRQLPGGLVSSVRTRQGTLTSTYEVVKLRLVAGVPADDLRLRTALEGVRSSIAETHDPLLHGAWVVLMDTVGAAVGETERREVVSSLKRFLPRTVGVENVDLWNRGVDILTSLDEEVTAVDVASWKPTSPELWYATTLLVNGLDRLERLDALTEPPKAADLLHRVEERLRSGTVREAAEALDAAHALGWTPRTADAERIGDLLEARRDCPGASAFYRDSARDTECGVPGTRAAYRITALLEGALPAEADR
ncbi:hypothetical protein NPS70_03115 [Streptomyces sp. C10-9-1]|uniref:hypothetical protein n=1 Tax=Streptomyces sp. C10-9-1 TaxID=1859285 RepID=UPI0021126F28|nr:hypothetical protein [Streptomyces sp. C10-9-1]MCQ6552196.1 hypothetical protein [Streptomyces sp. C10-9-1]